MTVPAGAGDHLGNERVLGQERTADVMHDYAALLRRGGTGAAGEPNGALPRAVLVPGVEVDTALQQVGEWAQRGPRTAPAPP